jgi:hypothetical protein
LWDDNKRKLYSERRKIEVANGIRVPPVGNAGNKDFRHTEEYKTQQSKIHKELRAQRVAERGSWITPEGQAIRKEKLAAYYTPERKQEHLAKIRAGRERARLKREEEIVTQPPE